MFHFRRPSAEQLRRFVAAQAGEPLTYIEAGMSRGTTAPPGFSRNHGRTRLGSGEETYRRAVQALQRWAMYDMDWIELLWPDTPIAVGREVGLLVRHYGFWSLNACRIVYVIDEREETLWRYGFGYGTLPQHAERGEERFTAEWRREDDSVWYELFSAARPGTLLTWVGYPFTRLLVRRFARDSLRAMESAVPAREG